VDLAQPGTPGWREQGVSDPVDLAGAPSGVGPLWGLQTDELNATLLEWPPGGGVAEHVNDELEVLLLVLAGSASVGLDGSEHRLSAGTLLLVPRGSARSISAGRDGVRYLSVHRRRGPLLPSPRSGPSGA
jgi:quercetin dioxygenase-like cupin family protein